MTIGAAQQFFLGASKATGGGAAGYQIERSLRFNSSDSGYLSRTPASAGNRKTWTWAGWVKRSGLSANGYLLEAGASDTASARFIIRFSSDNTLLVSRGQNTDRITSQVFRDVSAWCHLVVACDTTQATPNDRIKIYFNGTQITTFSSTSNPGPNDDLGVNAAAIHAIGRSNVDSGDYFNGYLADIHFIDGQALTPSSFTEVSATTGQLIPKAYTGSFNVGAGAVNGFWLKFSDNSAATATTLGKDYSGNSNNWTPNNLQVSDGRIYSTSALVTTNSTEVGSGYPRSAAFNGTTSGAFAVYDNVARNAYIDVVFSPSLNASSGLRFYWDGDGSGTYVVSVNGGSTSSAGTRNAFNSLGNFSTLSSFRIAQTAGRDGSVGDGLALFAIEVNGSILSDSNFTDSLVDTPTSYGTDTGAGGEVRGNYCTLNPLKNPGGSTTFSNGNLEATFNLSGTFPVPMGTFGVSSGKWYWEITPTSGASGAGGVGIGIGNAQCVPTSAGALGVTANGWAYYYTGNKYNNNTSSAYGVSYTNNDIIGVALDCDNGTLVFYKNGVSQGTAYTGLTSGPYFPAMGNSGDTTTCVCNFGQRAFAYQTPGTNRPAATFLALCDTNLGPPLVAKPNQHFDIITYPGNGSTQTIPNATSTPATALDFGGVGQIGFSWIKQRSDPSTSHAIYDARRGVQARLESDTTDQEATSDNGVTAFNAGTIALGSQAQANSSSETYVAWCWATDDQDSSSHTQGSITSQVRANASAGFSIVSYTAAYTGSARTVGHGLGVKPSLIILKNRSDGSANWRVYHSASGASLPLILNSTAAASANIGIWNNTEPTSSVFTIGVNTDVGGNIGSGEGLIAYCFAPVVGYSSFGSYTGNGSTDGPFVYTGFRPRWVMIKNSSASGDSWVMHDTARNTFNVVDALLMPNQSTQETTSTNYYHDILSNGFKLRTSLSAYNSNGATYIYAAFAENPFQYSRAR